MAFVLLKEVDNEAGNWRNFRCINGKEMPNSTTVYVDCGCAVVGFGFLAVFSGDSKILKPMIVQNFKRWVNCSSLLEVVKEREREYDKMG